MKTGEQNFNYSKKKSFMSWTALIHQEIPFGKINPCFILILKTMYCNHQIIIPIGGQQYLSTSFVFLLHFQMQIWKGFFSHMNSIKLTLWGQFIIYSLNTLFRIRSSRLRLFTGKIFKNVWIVSETPRNV